MASAAYRPINDRLPIREVIALVATGLSNEEIAGMRRVERTVQATPARP
jgi:ATP/maltotriose-dependent transcriptional regulator MalT